MALLAVVAVPSPCGLNVGGTIAIPVWNENDNLKFQLVAGRGIGRYINDSNSIGGQDAVFGPDNDLEALPIRSGVATLVGSWVAINPSVQFRQHRYLRLSTRLCIFENPKSVDKPHLVTHLTYRRRGRIVLGPKHQ